MQRILTDQEDRCRVLLTERRHALDLIARALLEHETISGDDVNRLLGLSTDTGPGDAAPPEATDGVPVDGVPVDGATVDGALATRDRTPVD